MRFLKLVVLIALLNLTCLTVCGIIFDRLSSNEMVTIMGIWGGELALTSYIKSKDGKGAK